MKSMPSKRFQGLTGKIIGQRGRAYFIQIRDGGKMKKVLSKPEHLKAIKTIPKAIKNVPSSKSN